MSTRQTSPYTSFVRLNLDKVDCLIQRIKATKKEDRSAALSVFFAMAHEMNKENIVAPVGDQELGLIMGISKTHMTRGKSALHKADLLRTEKTESKTVRNVLNHRFVWKDGVEKISTCRFDKFNRHEEAVVASEGSKPSFNNFIQLHEKSLPFLAYLSRKETDAMLTFLTLTKYITLFKGREYSRSRYYNAITVKERAEDDVYKVRGKILQKSALNKLEMYGLLRFDESGTVCVLNPDFVWRGQATDFNKCRFQTLACKIDAESMEKYEQFTREKDAAIQEEKERQRKKQIIKDSRNKHMLVTAGAGTGKTWLLTERYHALLKSKRIKPENILSVTFTKNAADEMKKRSLEKVDATPQMSTFHAFCRMVLETDEARIAAAFDNVFCRINFYNDNTQRNKLRDIYLDHGHKMCEEQLRRTLELIEVRKRDFKDFSCFLSFKKAAAHMTPAIEDRVVEAYIQQQFDPIEKRLTLDYDDQIALTIAHFRNAPDIKAEWQSKIRYISIDEAQDAGRGEIELLKELCRTKTGYKTAAKLFVVGDDDQSIYGWRDKEVSSKDRNDELARFLRDELNAIETHLTYNYRSTPEIISVANQLISANTGRKEKSLIPTNPSGPKVVHKPISLTEEEGLLNDQALWRKFRRKREAEWIAETILEHRKIKPDDTIAVLYRNRGHAEALPKFLLAKNIPYQDKADKIQTSDKALRWLNVLDYLRLKINISDDKAFKRILKDATKGLDKDAKSKVEKELWSKIKVSRRKHSLSGYLLRLHEKEKVFNCYTKKSMGFSNENMGSVFYRFVNALSDYEKEATKTSSEINIDDFYEQFIKEEERHHVQLMTIHAAKGLEFSCVFVMGLSQGAFPGSSQPNYDKEEERRLCYVAMTRAKEQLYLTGSDNSSTFVKEVWDNEHLERLE